MFRWLVAVWFVLVLTAVGGARETAPVDDSPVATKPAFVAEGYFYLRENHDGKPDTVIFFPNDTVEYEVEYSDCLNRIITRDDLERRRFRVKGETEKKSDVCVLRIHSFEVIPEKPSPTPAPAAKAGDKPVRPKKKK